ncbi:LPXTG-motif cell wall-anchored protein [Bacillus oleivorans]|uniref:LPXTG-motif cell wall-anchored protein n=1 Tax=Bacillus oleivorans TaxID=1448271 RepID=A0A285CNY0_9BACI|nr:hypothetical protein [Bacillus oleivorans]SNX68766.1 LPXTG-motif cell wall-anchored protein [Bacillus oleivorans]
MYRKSKGLFALMMGLIISFLLIQPSLANSEAILEKQAEIDQYLFVDHLDEIEEMGIHVTHTSPVDTYVEIGISPYSDEHAEYLTEIFGAEFVKVVEGQQAVTLTTGADTVSPETAINNHTEETSGSTSASVWWFTGIGAVLLAVVLFTVIRRRKQTVS